MREWILTAAVILVPLLIAVAVTVWSLDQARYRPKRRTSKSSAHGRHSPIAAQTPDGERMPDG